MPNGEDRRDELAEAPANFERQPVEPAQAEPAPPPAAPERDEQAELLRGILAEIKAQRPAEAPYSGFLRRLFSTPTGWLKAIEPWAIALAIAVFFIDYQGRVEQRTVAAWQLLTTPASGNSGKIEALEYLNSEDGIWCWKGWRQTRAAVNWMLKAYRHETRLDVTCYALLLKKQTPLVGVVFDQYYSNSLGVYIQEVDLPRAILTNSSFPGANLYKANFYKAFLGSANFNKANLEFADLREAYIVRADMRDARLTKAELQGANLSEADLRNATLIQANMQGVDLLKADLRGANLLAADLRGAYLGDVNLQEAVLLATDLQGAYLGKADLRRAEELERSELQGAYVGLTLFSFSNTSFTLDAFNKLINKTWAFDDEPASISGAPYPLFNYPEHRLCSADLRDEWAKELDKREAAGNRHYGPPSACKLEEVASSP